MGESPTTTHTPGETPAPLADLADLVDLADLAPNSVQFLTLTAFLYYSPIAPASSVLAEIVGTKRLCQSQSPLVLGWSSDRYSRTLCPTMADSSCHGHVGYVVWPRISGSRKILVCLLDVWCFRRWQSVNGLLDGQNASNQLCGSSNALPDRCGQEPRVSVALWGRADVVGAGTFLEHVCHVLGCPGRNSRRPGPGWCRRSTGERRNA